MLQLIVNLTRSLRRPSDLKKSFWSFGDYALLLLGGAQLVLMILLVVCCWQGSEKGTQCVSGIHVDVVNGTAEAQ